MKAQAAPPGVILAEKQRMELLLTRYLAWAAEEHGDAWKPARFELAFGPARGNSARDTTQPPFPLRGRLGARALQRPHRPHRRNMATWFGSLTSYRQAASRPLAESTRASPCSLGFTPSPVSSAFPGKTCPEALFVRVGRADNRRAIGGKRFDRTTYEAMLLARWTVACAASAPAVFAPLPRARTCYGCTTAHICHEKARIDRKVPPPLLAECGAGGGEDADAL